MVRTTRQKAAEITESVLVHDDENRSIADEATGVHLAKAGGAEGPPQSHADRAPLGELQPNSAAAESNAHSQQQGDEGVELRKSTRGRKVGGKKGAASKGKSGGNVDLSASTVSLAHSANTQDVEVLPDTHEAVPSPASERAAEELIMEPYGSQTVVHDTRSKSPTSAAVRLTRSQMAKKAELAAEPQAEPKSLVDGIGQGTDEQDAQAQYKNVQVNGLGIDTTGSVEDKQPAALGAIDAPASPLLSAVPNVIQSLRADTPAKRSTSNKENVEPLAGNGITSPTNRSSVYDALEDAVVSSASPPQPRPRPEDHIDALDALEDAVEDVSKGIPEVQTSPEKPKTQKDARENVKKEGKKAAPVVRTTKASQARLSMAHGGIEKAPALGKPRPSIAADRAAGARQSSIHERRVTSTSSVEDSKPNDGERKEVEIPHSKRRPISISFPTPPPPPKSTKAPTQSTFQLPGEAVAAKLKAQRDARLQKEASEEVEKKQFKARPVPAGLEQAPKVRHTSASMARESLMAESKELKASTSASAASRGLKRASSIATSSVPRTAPKDAPKPSSSSSRPSTNSLNVNKRASAALGTLSKPRASLAHKDVVNTTGSKGTSKGKEVFNRAATAKAAAEKEKLEKEAAAKKARAEAAERGRQASREWAEKQRLKKLADKTLHCDAAASQGQAGEATAQAPMVA